VLGLAGLLATFFTTILVVFGLLPAATTKATATPAPPPVATASAAPVEVGVVTVPLAQNEYQQWQPSELSSVDVFEHEAHKHAGVVAWYADWQHNQFSLAQLQAVGARGSIPQITWEPWDGSQPLYTPQPRYTLANILAGNFDGYIRRSAQVVARYGRPVWLRFAQEMNGTWYPWDEQANGNHPGEFVRVWRHIHDIFAAAGATNVRWIWAPVANAPRAYFPGTRYVDMLGVTCLNGGKAMIRKGWRSFARICGRSISKLHALAPGLGVEISELGTAENGGSKATWIRNTLAFIANRPFIRGFVWFDISKETNWRIDSSGSARRAFAIGVRPPRFK